MNSVIDSVTMSGKNNKQDIHVEWDSIYYKGYLKIMGESGFKTVKEFINVMGDFSLVKPRGTPVITGKKITKDEFIQGIQSEKISRQKSSIMEYRYFRDVPYFRVFGDDHIFTHYYDSLNMDECSFTVQKSRSLIRKKECRKFENITKRDKGISSFNGGFKKGPVSRGEKEMIRDLSKKGKTVQEISQTVKRSGSFVYFILSKN